MITNYLRDLASMNGYSNAGSYFFKEIKGYLVLMSEKDGKVYTEVSFDLDGMNLPFEISKKAEEISNQEKVSDCILSSESIVLIFRNDSLRSDEVRDLIALLVNLLEEYRIKADNRCKICRENINSEEVAYVKFNGKIAKAHKECYKIFANKIEEEKKKEDLFKGIFGAVIFGLIGTIPWVIASIVGFFASLLGLVIGICANFGYSLFKGKRGKVKVITLVSVVISMVIIGNFISELYDLFDYLKSESITGVSLKEATRIIIDLITVDGEYRISFIKNIVLGILFGIAGAWKYIKTNGGKKEISDVDIELVNVN